jgi:hypothetical protein
MATTAFGSGNVLPLERGLRDVDKQTCPKDVGGHAVAGAGTSFTVFAGQSAELDGTVGIAGQRAGVCCGNSAEKPRFFSVTSEFLVLWVGPKKEESHLPGEAGGSRGFFDRGEGGISVGKKKTEHRPT